MKDITGQKSGRLTVAWPIGYIGKRRNGQIMWMCFCKCGNYKPIAGESIRRKHTKSCGCFNVESLQNRPRHLGHFRRTELEAMVNSMHNSTKRGAKARKYEFFLTKADIEKLITSDCFWGGCKPELRTVTWGKRKVSYPINGIDRRDNRVGYILSNCVACCGKHNQMKMDFSESEFISLATSVARIHVT
jgi:hypothetical protein